MTNENLRMQMLSGIITEGEYKAKLEENAAPIHNVVTMDGKTMVGTHQYGVGFKANKKGIEMGFEDNPKEIPNGTKMVKNDAESLNESMIGGIVGIGAINQIPPRAKADYEMAFEHFLGERYETKFENREQDPYTMKEDDSSNDMDQQIANLDEGGEEIRLSNEILDFLEERGMIDPSDAQKVHKDLTAFLEDKVKSEKLKENNPLIGGAGFMSKTRINELAQLIKSAKLELARQRDMMTPEQIAQAEETIAGLTAARERAIEKYKEEIKDNYSGMREGEEKVMENNGMNVVANILEMIKNGRGDEEIIAYMMENNFKSEEQAREQLLLLKGALDQMKQAVNPAPSRFQSQLIAMRDKYSR